VALLVFTSIVAGFCESIILALLAEIATALVNHRSSLTIRVGPLDIVATIDQLLLLGLIVAVLRVALQGVLSYLPARIAADVRRTLQHRIFAAFTQASWSVVSSEGEGTFQELATSQINQASSGVIYATTALTSLFLLIVLVLSALVIEIVTALVVMAAGLVLFLLFRPLDNLGRRHSQALSSAQVRYASGVHDAVSTAEEAHVFGVGDVQLEHIGQLAAVEQHRIYWMQFLGRLIAGGYQTLVLLLLLAGLAILQAIGAAGHLASLGAVVLLLVRASTFGQMVQSNYHMMHQSMPYLDRLHEAEERYVTSHIPSGLSALKMIPSIAFNNVTFSYVPERLVLQSLSFAVEPAEVIGVVGPTGSGKSTLVQLLVRLREPQSGTYLVAGQPAREWSDVDWARHVSYLPQEPRLIHGTVAENIRFYRNLNDNDVERAARQAQIHEEIIHWPLQYQTVISDRAKAVSGGQRQRLCLARALAGSPLMLVLDEPTSALDPRSEALVQQSLSALKGHVTLFVIAHRMSTLKLCDRVMVLRNGGIEAFARPDEVFESNEFYKNAVSLSQSNLLDSLGIPDTTFGESRPIREVS
jgi:ABC-type multidrug transport system fused ATPase/permease subunit